MVSPLEAKKPGALDQQNGYLQAISRYPASKLHFFDESKRCAIASMGMLESASKLLKCNVYNKFAPFSCRCGLLQYSSRSVKWFGTSKL